MIRKREPENEIIPHVRYGFSCTAERLGYQDINTPLSNELYLLENGRKKSPRTSA